MKNVVVIGGGTGVYTVLTGLKKYSYHLAAVVSMADDGGSTGVLRDEFGVLPPGDIRRALAALSESDKIMVELFNYRFDAGSSLKGHSLGNLLLTALEKITGSFESAVEEAVKILNVKGNVIPVTLQNTRLCAELENGQVVHGETNIDVPKHDGALHIKRIYLDPPVTANPRACHAIETADAVILGPGDLYTSILPNVAAEGLNESLRKTKAKVIYIVNIMTKFGETNEFTVSSFISEIENYIGKGIIDTVIVNTGRPEDDLLKKYEESKDTLVELDQEQLNSDMHIVTGDFIREGRFIRHDPTKLAKVLSEVIDAD